MEKNSVVLYLLLVVSIVLVFQGCRINSALDSESNFETICIEKTPNVTVYCPVTNDQDCYLTIQADSKMMYSVYSGSNQNDLTYNGLIRHGEQKQLLPRIFLSSVSIEPYIGTPYYNCQTHQFTFGKSKFIIVNDTDSRLTPIKVNESLQKK